jgi:hypothetical protein
LRGEAYVEARQALVEMLAVKEQRDPLDRVIPANAGRARCVQERRTGRAKA